MMSKNFIDRHTGCLLGLAVGDAVGTTLEFEIKDSCEHITDMVGGGPFYLKPGEWTDDTSMALCLAKSLIESEGFNITDQIERYCRWQDSGYMSSNGSCFDIGNTVSSALRVFQNTGNPYAGSTDPLSAGNGSLMRLAPVALYYSQNVEQLVHYCAESSKSTHGAAECIDACSYFGSLLYAALQGENKENILTHKTYQPVTKEIQAIADGQYRGVPRQQIYGTGYVVDSLRAALWCFDQAENYREAILLAANLGDDADTTAAICGQIAGAYYGESAIPKTWLKTIVGYDLIKNTATQLIQT
jgi:ADP-ribosyl-[dinitrogen reductase] hydrolase